MRTVTFIVAEGYDGRICCIDYGNGHSTACDIGQMSDAEGEALADKTDSDVRAANMQRTDELE